MYQTLAKRRGVRVIAFASIESTAAAALPFEASASGDVIIVDLSSVVYLNRARLMTLLRFIAAVRASGANVGLVGLSGRVRLLAQKMYLHRFVEIFNTVEEVFRSLALPVNAAEEPKVHSTGEHLAARQEAFSEPVSQEVLQ
jgi:anti-anti-sigma regulatory factor